MRSSMSVRRLVVAALLLAHITGLFAPILRAQGIDTTSVGSTSTGMSGMSLLDIQANVKPVAQVVPLPTLPTRPNNSFFFCENPLPAIWTRWYLVTDAPETTEGRELTEHVRQKLIQQGAPADGWEVLHTWGEDGLRRRVHTLMMMRKVASYLGDTKRHDADLKAAVPKLGEFVGGVLDGAWDWGKDFVLSIPRTLYDLSAGMVFSAASEALSFVSRKLGFGDVDLDPANHLAGPPKLTPGLLVKGVYRLGNFLSRLKQDAPLTLAEFPADFLAATLRAKDAHGAGYEAANSALDQGSMVAAVFSLPALARGMVSLARTGALIGSEAAGALTAARSWSDIPKILAKQGRAVAVALSLEGGMTISAISVQYPKLAAAGRGALRLLPVAANALADTRAALWQMVTELKCGLILAIEEIAPGATGKLKPLAPAAETAKALPGAAAASKWSRASAEALLDIERTVPSELSGNASKGAVHVPPPGVDPLQNVISRLSQPGAQNLPMNTGWQHPRHAAVDLRDCLNANAAEVQKLVPGGGTSQMLLGSTPEPRIGPEIYPVKRADNTILEWRVRTVQFQQVELKVYKTTTGQLRIHHFQPTAQTVVTEGWAGVNVVP